ncbi:sensor histidine kinase [Paenibacillus rhizoplanae]
MNEYINIQRARFRDRIAFEMEIDEQAMDGMVPCLTLQPIFENAFVHGLEQMEEGAILTLSIRYRSGQVEIVISDNGAGMNRETVARLMGSIQQEAPHFSGKGQSTGLGTHNVFLKDCIYSSTASSSSRSTAVKGRGRRCCSGCPSGPRPRGTHLK